MGKVVVVVAAHPDDEVLGCGGAIANHALCGDSVHVIFMADGVTSRVGGGDTELNFRNEAAENAAVIMGTSSTSYLGLPDNRMDSLALLDLVQPLERLLEELKPEIIYTHHSADLNIDHRLTHEAVMTACRPQPWSTVRKILSFEVLSSTEWRAPNAGTIFIPNYYVDVTNVIDIKIRALEAYATEMRVFPNSRSYEHVKALMTHRGASVGLSAAESFQVNRIICVDESD